MKKIIGIFVLIIGITLSGCVDENTSEIEGLTKEQMDRYIEDYFQNNKDDLIDQLTEEEIDAIVAAYIEENREDIVGDYINDNADAIIDELTAEEIELIVLAWLEENPVENFVDTTYDLDSFEDAVIDMLDQAQSGVLGIIAISDYSGGTGSGVVYKKEGTSTYYLVTNEHVVVHSENVYLDGVLIETNPFPADDISIVYEKNGLLFTITEDVILVGYDATTDLAVLTFESDEEFTVIPFGNSYEVKSGQTVFAVGNPLGFDYYGTVTSGVISGEARYMTDGDFDATLLQHDAAISPGNSGGALLNMNGELLGINNMKIVVDDVSNIGFAIPVNTVKRIVADLEDDGIITRPYLGISTFASINDCGLDYGVCVTVSEGGAAEAAGLVDGDIIIGYKNEGETEFLEINNFNDLREAILNSSVGESIVIKYIRFEDIEGVNTPVEYESIETELNTHPDDQ
jgi:serine protease Do